MQLVKPTIAWYSGHNATTLNENLNLLFLKNEVNKWKVAASLQWRRVESTKMRDLNPTLTSTYHAMGMR